MDLIYSFAVGWVAGSAILLGIMLELHKLANLWTRITTLCGVLVVAKTISNFL